MAEKRLLDHMNAPLLDRLIDGNPRGRVSAKEQAPFSLPQLRESVIRELNTLFNALPLQTAPQWQGQDFRVEDVFPHVAKSVVNFGIPVYSGSTASGLDLQVVTNSLERAIHDFEPRVVDVRVYADIHDDNVYHFNKISFAIECKLWAYPSPVELRLETGVDLESGETVVKEAGQR